MCVRVRSCERSHSLPALSPPPSPPKPMEPQMRGGEKQNKNQRPLRTTVHTLVIIVTRAQGSGSPPPPVLAEPSRPRGRERPGGGRRSALHSLSSGCTLGNQRTQGTAPRTSGQQAGHREGGRKEGDKLMKMGHQSHQPGSQGDLRRLAPSPCSVPTPQLPLSPGSAPGGHLHGAVPSQAWLQRQLVGMKRGGGG